MSCRGFCTLITLENIIGVYRNYYCFNREKKFLICVRLILDVLLLVFHTLGNVTSVDRKYVVAYFFYAILTSTNMISILFVAVSSSKGFVLLIENMNEIHDYYARKNGFKQNTKMLQFFFTIITMIGVTSACITYGLEFESHLAILLNIISMVFELRYYVELSRYALTLSRINYLIIIVDTSANEIISAISEERKDTMKDARANALTPSTFEKDVCDCAEHCQILINCSRLLDTCFNKQICLCLFASIIFCIFCIGAVVESVLEKGSPILTATESINVIINLGVYTVLLLVTMRSGQNVQNGWKNLNKSLSKLHNILLSDQETPGSKSVRDLARLVRTQPVRPLLMTTLPLQMALLPATVSLVATHIIILLQINKAI